MKRNLVLLSCFLMTTFCYAQKQERYRCDDSRVGKLITKPLMKKGIINYELAHVEGQKFTKEGNDYVVISKTDSLSETTVFRIYTFNKDSMLQLKFDYNAADDGCQYTLLFMPLKDGKTNFDPMNMRRYLLTRNGEIDENRMGFIDSERERAALKDVKTLLKYLE